MSVLHSSDHTAQGDRPSVSLWASEDSLQAGWRFDALTWAELGMFQYRNNTIIQTLFKLPSIHLTLPQQFRECPCVGGSGGLQGCGFGL